MLPRLLQQRVPFANRSNDLVATVPEQPDQPLLHHRSVLGDHDPHGTTSRVEGKLDGDFGRSSARVVARPIPDQDVGMGSDSSV
jgi:hypothetical protein